MTTPSIQSNAKTSHNTQTSLHFLIVEKGRQPTIDYRENLFWDILQSHVVLQDCAHPNKKWIFSVWVSISRESVLSKIKREKIIVPDFTYDFDNIKIK